MRNEEIIEVDINLVELDKNINRKSFDTDTLKELAELIKEKGVLIPLMVFKEDDKYRIMAGERRWRAAQMAGVKTIPVIIKEK